MPCAVAWSRARRTGFSITNSPRSRYAGLMPALAGSAVGDTRDADQSLGSSRPASTARDWDHSLAPRSVQTHTRTSRRSPDSSGRPAQGRRIQSSLSTRIEVPSSSSSSHAFAGCCPPADAGTAVAQIPRCRGARSNAGLAGGWVGSRPHPISALPRPERVSEVWLPSTNLIPIPPDLPQRNTQSAPTRHPTGEGVGVRKPF